MVFWNRSLSLGHEQSSINFGFFSCVGVTKLRIDFQPFAFKFSRPNLVHTRTDILICIRSVLKDVHQLPFKQNESSPYRWSNCSTSPQTDCLQHPVWDYLHQVGGRFAFVWWKCVLRKLCPTISGAFLVFFVRYFGECIWGESCMIADIRMPSMLPDMFGLVWFVYMCLILIKYGLFEQPGLDC